MTNTYDYTFQNMSRIGEDLCSLNQSESQNVKFGNYNLTNYHINDCTMSKPLNFALNQPNINFSGSKQVGLGGCNIDINSELLVGKTSTNQKDRLSLNQRPFVSVPYLGRGKADPDLETQLKQGDQYPNRKSINPSSEVSYVQYDNYPLISSIKDSVANPSNTIEDNADENWIRGGLPSRELTRDNGKNN
jgi:hypothetical protein